MMMLFLRRARLLFRAAAGARVSRRLIYVRARAIIGGLVLSDTQMWFRGAAEGEGGKKGCIMPGWESSVRCAGDSIMIFR